MPAMLAALATSAFLVIPHPPVETAKDHQIMITSLSLGAADPAGKVPTANGVPGAGVNNWDISLPSGVLTQGQDYYLSFSSDSASYTGSCLYTVELTQVQDGHKVLLGSENFSPPGGCVPGQLLVATDFHKIPASPGPVTLSMKVKYDGGKAQIKLPMVIQ
jgi:hypothetical protein